MTPSDLKEGISALYSILGQNGEHWTQKAIARTADGLECHPADGDAVSWCLLGAIYALREYDRNWGRAVELIWVFNGVLQTLGKETSLILLNDSGTWDDVKNLMNLAVEAR